MEEYTMEDEILEPVDNEITNDIDNDSEDFSGGEAELLEALKQLNQEEIDDEDDDLDSEELDEEVQDEEDDSLDSDDELEEELEDEEPELDNEPAKKVQSKEENAKFAQRRREQEMQKKIDAEIAKLREEAPEFALAKQLSDMYGTTPDVLVEQMREAALQKESQEKGIPLEFLKEQQAEKAKVEKLEAELNKIRYEGWQNKIKSESVKLQSDFKMLTEDDITSAVDYILYEAQNVDMSLEEAVYAKHGKKIIDSLVKKETQEKLATESGRKKKTPPAPSNGKAVAAPKSLSKEEQYIARQLGMSEADYLKYK